MTSPIETNNVVERLAIALIVDESSHLQLKYLKEALKVCLSECELELVPASEHQSLSDRIDVLAKLAGDVRWKELAEGSPFTVIDRMMLRDLHAAGQASLTQGGKNV